MDGAEKEKILGLKKMSVPGRKLQAPEGLQSGGQKPHIPEGPGIFRRVRSLAQSWLCIPRKTLEDRLPQKVA